MVIGDDRMIGHDNTAACNCNKTRDKTRDRDRVGI